MRLADIVLSGQASPRRGQNLGNDSTGWPFRSAGNTGASTPKLMRTNYTTRAIGTRVLSKGRGSTTL